MAVGNRAALAAVLALAGTAPATSAHPKDDEPPVRIIIQSPLAGPFKGLTTPTGWNLVIRLEAPDSVGVIEAAEGALGRREAVVLEDPDGCIDMRDFALQDSGRIPYQDCLGPDERYFEFTPERFDSFDLEDTNTGNFQIRERLVDDAFAPGALLNKPYLRNTQGRINPLPRPQTGGALLDGYGFGPDDDLPGLVVIADMGAARAFDADFDRVPGVVRNLAGFTNTVSVELLDRRGATAVTAFLHVLAGLFEPLALFDRDVADPGADFLRRLESGPVESFRFVAPPADDDALFAELLSTYAPYELELSVLLVEGTAPTFVRDLDGDRRYTAADLRRMGHTVLSNTARLRLRLDFDALITQTPRGRTCPPQSMIFTDLDGNGRDGAVACSGSGGAARITPKPR